MMILIESDIKKRAAQVKNGEEIVKSKSGVFHA